MGTHGGAHQLHSQPLSRLSLLSMYCFVVQAIFSVPLLGVMKILLSHTNHPMAKYVIMLIREDATVDEQAEASKSPAPGGGKDGAAGGE